MQLIVLSHWKLTPEWRSFCLRSPVCLRMPSGTKRLTGSLPSPAQRLDLLHSRPNLLLLGALSPMPFAGRKMPVWKSFPQAPSCPLFRIYVSLMLHCAALLVKLGGHVLFGPLFFSLLTYSLPTHLEGIPPRSSTRKGLVLKSRRHRFHGLFL